MAASPGLSVVVITKNEERNLDRCLRSVSWANQIVVVDSGSTDRTREVAARHGAEFEVRTWPGFVEQWNYAISRAREPWVLVLAADEWLDEAGANEVREELQSPRADGYELDRIAAFCGAFLHRVWSPDWQLRLFRREKGRFRGGLVHESVQLDPGCRVLRLEERLFHLTYRSIHEFVDRMNRYTDLAAATMRAEGRKGSIGSIVVRPAAAFVKSYVLKRGFLDGFRGFFVSAGGAFYVFLKLAKLRELSRTADPSFLEVVGSTPEDPRPAELS